MEKKYHRLENLDKIITEKIEGEPQPQTQPQTQSPSQLPPANCMDCEHHCVLPDPDPDDWFCYDDEKVLCTLAKKNVTVACRPHHKRKECTLPSWCPWAQVNQA